MSTINEEIHSLIMEQASETATILAKKDWGETRKGFYIYDEHGTGRMSEEAQDIFNDYYNEQMEQLENLVKASLPEVVKPKKFDHNEVDQHLHMTDDGFCWLIVNDKAKEVYNTGLFDLYHVSTNDTESLIESFEELDNLLSNGELIGIEVGHTKNS